jgi:hypothetical protein
MSKTSGCSRPHINGFNSHLLLEYVAPREDPHSRIRGNLTDSLQLTRVQEKHYDPKAGGNHRMPSSP